MAPSNHWGRVRKAGATLCGVLSCFLPAAAQAQAPAFLVQDINTQQWIVSSDPHDFLTIGTTTFFVASTLETGDELWKSDGTAAGTVLVRTSIPVTPAPIPLG